MVPELSRQTEARTVAWSRTEAPLASAPGRVKRVLLAEDDAELRRLLAGVLRQDGFDVIEARDGVDGFGFIEPWVFWDAREDRFDLIISDVRMPGWTGIDLLRIARARRLPAPVILITAFGATELHAEARRLGAAAVFDKPFDIDALRSAARRLTQAA